MEWSSGEFLITDDISRVDRKRTFDLLSQTYWGVRRPFSVVEKMIQHSMCFTLLHESVQVGFGTINP